MRPGEAQSGGSNTLNPCQMSLKVQNGSVLLTCEYAVHFLSVATDERGPGGMKQITGVEDYDIVRRQVPWAGPPPPRTREES